MTRTNAFYKCVPKQVGQFFCLLIAGMMATLGLTACTPAFDWRSQKASTHGDNYRLEYPGKPLSAQRTVILAEQSVTLTLSGVQAQEAQFALGHVPAKDALQAKIFAQALAQSFISNLHKQSNANPTPSPPALKTIALANALGAFELQTTVGGTFAVARFVWTSHAAYELLAVGEAGKLPIEVAEQFVRSFQFEP